MRDLSLHLMDILQNSLAAESNKIDVTISAHKEKDLLEIIVEDNGKGIDEEILKNITSPFATTRTTRKVGLGIPLLEASAKRSGGDLTVTSQKGVGTVLKASFVISNIDRMPLGDVSATITGIIMANPDLNLNLYLNSRENVFTFRTLEIKEKLGDVPINQFEVIMWMGEYIREGINNIFGGVLDEILS